MYKEKNDNYYYIASKYSLFEYNNYGLLISQKLNNAFLLHYFNFRLYRCKNLEEFGIIIKKFVILLKKVKRVKKVFIEKKAIPKTI